MIKLSCVLWHFSAWYFSASVLGNGKSVMHYGLRAILSLSFYLHLWQMLSRSWLAYLLITNIISPMGHCGEDMHHISRTPQYLPLVEINSKCHYLNTCVRFAGGASLNLLVMMRWLAGQSKKSKCTPKSMHMSNFCHAMSSWHFWLYDDYFAAAIRNNTKIDIGLLQHVLKSHCRRRLIINSSRMLREIWPTAITLAGAFWPKASILPLDVSAGARRRQVGAAPPRSLAERRPSCQHFSVILRAPANARW